MSEEDLTIQFLSEAALAVVEAARDGSLTPELVEALYAEVPEYLRPGYTLDF